MGMPGVILLVTAHPSHLQCRLACSSSGHSHMAAVESVVGIYRTEQTEARLCMTCDSTSMNCSMWISDTVFTSMRQTVSKTLCELKVECELKVGCELKVECELCPLCMMQTKAMAMQDSMQKVNCLDPFIYVLQCSPSIVPFIILCVSHSLARAVLLSWLWS